MPHDSNSNAPASAPTSRSAPNAPANKPSPANPKADDKPTGPASESAFLTKQAADAQAAMTTVANELKQDVAQAVDPRAWMQVAPWTTLATAAVAGFLAAAATIPSKEQQALRRLRRMEKTLEEEDRSHAQRNGHDRKSADTGKSSLMGSAMGSLLAAVQPLLVSVLNNAIGARTAPPPAAVPPDSQSTGSGEANPT